MRILILVLLAIASACATESDYIDQALENQSEFGTPIPHARFQPEIDAVEYAMSWNDEPRRDISAVNIYQIEDTWTHCWGHVACAFGNQKTGENVILIPTKTPEVTETCTRELACGKSVGWLLIHELAHAMMTEVTTDHENGFWDVVKTANEQLGLEGIGP